MIMYMALYLFSTKKDSNQKKSQLLITMKAENEYNINVLVQDCRK